MASSPIQTAEIYDALRQRFQSWATDNGVVILDLFQKEFQTPDSKWASMQLMSEQGSPTVDLTVFEGEGFCQFNLAVPKGTSEYKLLKLGDNLAARFPAGLTMQITGATITLVQPPVNNGGCEEFGNFLIGSVRIPLKVS